MSIGLQFSYSALPWNIVFGAGTLAQLPGEVDKLGHSRALILTTPQQADDGLKIMQLLDGRCIGSFNQAQMHVPMTTVQAAIERVVDLDADCCVSLGGGSTTGLGKALALKLGLPNIAIPTSFAGSEMTNIWGISDDGRKVTGRDNAVVPDLTIYDPELTLSLPAKFAAASGLNAMAQAVVNVASGKDNPIDTLMALEAVRALYMGLPKIVSEPDNIDARTDVLYGACLAGASLGTGTTSLHHRLCHTLGGSFNTPHAETHTVLLPHTMAYNAKATAADTARLAEAMGVVDAAEGIFQLAKLIGAPVSLKEIGVSAEDLDGAAMMATKSPVDNPEPATMARVRVLLENAYQGTSPTPVD